MTRIKLNNIWPRTQSEAWACVFANGIVVYYVPSEQKTASRKFDKILKFTFGPNAMPWMRAELAVHTLWSIACECEKIKNIIIDMKLRPGVKNKLWAEVLELLKYIYFDIWRIRSLPCSHTFFFGMERRVEPMAHIGSKLAEKILCEKYRGDGNEAREN